MLLTVGLAILIPVYMHGGMKERTAGSEQTLAAALTLSELSLILLSASCTDERLVHGLTIAFTVPSTVVVLPIYVLLDATPALRGYLLALTVGLPMLALCAAVRAKTDYILDTALGQYELQYNNTQKRVRRASLSISTAKFKTNHAFEGKTGGGGTGQKGAGAPSPRIGGALASGLDKEQQQKHEARRLEAARRHHRVRTLKRLILLFLSGALFVPLVVLLPLYLHGHSVDTGLQWRMSTPGQILLVLMFAPTDVLVIALLTSEIATYHATASTTVATSVLFSSTLVYTLGARQQVSGLQVQHSVPIYIPMPVFSQCAT
jgi:hypothetical protein